MTSLREKRVPSEIRQTIVRYLIQKSEHSNVSTFEAIHAIRKLIPHCELSDRELANLVAKSAADAGFVISFDGDRTS